MPIHRWPHLAADAGTQALRAVPAGVVAAAGRVDAGFAVFSAAGNVWCGAHAGYGVGGASRGMVTGLVQAAAGSIGGMLAGR